MDGCLLRWAFQSSLTVMPQPQSSLDRRNFSLDSITIKKSRGMPSSVSLCVCVIADIVLGTLTSSSPLRGVRDEYKELLSMSLGN